MRYNLWYFDVVLSIPKLVEIEYLYVHLSLYNKYLFRFALKLKIYENQKNLKQIWKNLKYMHKINYIETENIRKNIYL